ncbi:hypothetical protein [Pseudomonas putida]|uniref:HD domain-containing protein n=1 Tax=Pseudomonas putida TaxID=303 RepID=A0A8I1EIK7_PSEPU|nr:hypothetical protein [Pseudomonas putida]MBI6885843.1 hypothetical protein [Pseudomonas putida]
MNTTDYQKLLQTLRSQLIGMAKHDPDFMDCVQALNLAESSIHTGTRKDGKTPEFYHQLSILGYLITQHNNLQDPRSVYMAAILHDTIEDYPEFEPQIAAMFPRDVDNARGLSKMRNGELIPYSVYFAEMAKSPVMSVVKLVDRIHNVSTMQGVFKPEKMRKYIHEIQEYFLPMAKAARQSFPKQNAFYELAKSDLNMKVASYTYFLNEIERRSDKNLKHSDESAPGL